MKCPFCGGEMEIGVVQSARSMFFAKEERSLFFWEGAIKRRGEISLLSGAQLYRDRESLPAFHCEGCKKVLIDYADVPDSD